MKTLARLALWLLVVAISTASIGIGLGGAVLLPGYDAVFSFLVAVCGLVPAAHGMDELVGIADNVKLDLLIDWFRVRNWRRRRTWRSYAAALAGQSTAASFVPAAYR